MPNEVTYSSSSSPSAIQTMSSTLPDVPNLARASITSPPRSRRGTANSTSEHNSFHKNHRPHVHRHHLRTRDKDRGKDGDHQKGNDENPTLMSKSNLQPTIAVTSADAAASRSGNVTPAQSQNVSRRTSLLGFSSDADGSKEAELADEKEKGALRAIELRNELDGLNTLSNDTIRKIDNTYYSVLEKMGVLQNTISSLTELATMTRQLNTEFETEADKVANDVGTSLDAFHEFEAQQKRIQELTSRVEAGRDRVKNLGSRVDQVRERVEGWERAEGEWQDRTRKRLRLLWIMMSLAVAIMLALSVFQYTPTASPALDILSGLNLPEAVRSIPELEKLRNETLSLKKSTVEALRNMSSCSADEEVLPDDPRLRLFDEL